MRASGSFEGFRDSVYMYICICVLINGSYLIRLALIPMVLIPFEMDMRFVTNISCM